MKKYFFLLCAGLSFMITSCNDDDSAVAGASDRDSTEMTAEDKEERNKKVAMASIEDGINKHNVDAVLKDMAPDGKDYGDGTYPSVNHDSARYWLTAWLTAFPDIKGENLKAVADGDYVMVWGDWSGTWKGDFMGQKATGKSFEIKDVDIFRFNDEGKITEHHVVQHWGTSANQVGLKMQ